jgi:hypothetical protein
MRFFKSNSQFLTNEMGLMDGFSHLVGPLFLLDDPSASAGDDGAPAPATIDKASLPRFESDCVADGSSVFFLDLGVDDPAKARVFCRAAFHDNRDLHDARPMIMVGPTRGVILEPAHAYAAALTRRVKVGLPRSTAPTRSPGSRPRRATSCRSWCSTTSSSRTTAARRSRARRGSASPSPTSARTP